MYNSKVWTFVSSLWIVGVLIIGSESASLPEDLSNDRESSVNATGDYYRYQLDNGTEVSEIDALIKPEDNKGPPPPYIPNHEEFGEPSPYFPAENENSEKPPKYTMRDPMPPVETRVDIPDSDQTCTESVCLHECRQFCKRLAISGCFVLACTAVVACCNELVALRAHH
ncbi:uncharacterized protein LOC111693526 [Trichogramma pretiosum]|uniref:uncharacterized protein LOC111693526 n=1 Tax=Trichogramma pretiosum TaxID=7493 RepID=UPI000C71960F|nr:uncharacterized protein LOC111693526 [Trichogramma pretiosum]